ncbi:MAG: alpha/beta hydrolase [Alphaproteobacteria bacterium]|nr:alpha/beta hydrolase [Alphaproteobacteria bacterium]
MSWVELAILEDLMRSRPRPANPTPEFLRQRFRTMAGLFPLAADASIEPVTAHGVKAEFLAAPGADKGRTIFYLHGGGYVIGSPETHRSLAYDLSKAAAARVLSVDYGLAPERPFPAAVEDSLAAYGWLMANGGSAKRTVIAGDSAGGGLTIAALVALRDQGQPLPAAGVCFSPWTDLEGLGDSIKSRAAVDPMVALEGLTWMAGLYLGGADAKAPLAAPLYADLKGLPPLLIQVGDSEILRDDATRLAARATAAGVEVSLEVWPDMIHIWHYFAAMLSEGREAVERAGGFIRAKTG